MQLEPITSDSSAIAQRTVGDMRWQVVEDWQNELFVADESVVEQHLAQGRATVVKHGAQRTVYRVDLAQGSVFVKHHRCSALLAAGQQRLRGTASRREWTRARELSRRAIPTARPIAYGERQRSGMVSDHYFVTEAVQDAWPLDQFIDRILPEQPVGRRRKLILTLARFAAALHQAGVDHDDFHAGNVLIQWPATSDASPRLYLIDVPKIRFASAFNWRRSRESLAMFASALIFRATPRDRWRFWREYVRRRPDLPWAAPRAAAWETHARSLLYAQRIFRGRDRRCLRDNAEFYRHRTVVGTAHAVREVPQARLASLLADPALLLNNALQEAVKLSHSSVVVQTELPGDMQPSLRIAWKRCRRQRWWKRWLGPLRASRARTGWMRGHALLARGIATARPLALCEPRGGLWSRDSFLATAWIAGSMNLHLYGWRLCELPEAERRRRTRQVATSLGQLIGRMHRWQITHRDLKGCNLLVAEGADDVQTYLVDLDGVRQRRRLSFRQRARDLARLSASIEAHPWTTRTDRYRFLRAYLDHYDGAEPIAIDRLWRAVAPRTESVRRRLLRRGQIA